MGVLDWFLDTMKIGDDDDDDDDGFFDEEDEEFDKGKKGKGLFKKDKKFDFDEDDDDEFFEPKSKTAKTTSIKTILFFYLMI